MVKYESCAKSVSRQPFEPLWYSIKTSCVSLRLRVDGKAHAIDDVKIPGYWSESRRIRNRAELALHLVAILPDSSFTPHQQVFNIAIITGDITPDAWVCHVNRNMVAFILLKQGSCRTTRPCKNCPEESFISPKDFVDLCIEQLKGRWSGLIYSRQWLGNAYSGWDCQWWRRVPEPPRSSLRLWWDRVHVERGLPRRSAGARHKWTAQRGGQQWFLHIIRWLPHLWQSLADRSDEGHSSDSDASL